MSSSFSHETKNNLCEIYLKKPCCKAAFLYGVLVGANGLSRKEATLVTDHEKLAVLYSKMIRSVFHIPITPLVGKPMTLRGDVVGRMLEVFGYADGEEPTDRICAKALKCEYDAGSFLRGVFLACGTVSMPDSSYHLELLPENTDFCDALKEFLTEQGIEPKLVKRTSRKGASLYYKDSAAMEDFLNLIGAQKSAFQLMNVKIMRDLRNNANRVANCDMANIDKTITAATRQMEAIWTIADKGWAEHLPPQLKETFDLRAANPDKNLSDLAGMHNPPITKSGLSHRMSKLIAFSKMSEEEIEKYKK